MSLRPCDYLRNKLEFKGWTQRDLAWVLGVPAQSVCLLLSGKRGISASMALALSDALGISPEFLMYLQMAYDISTAKAPSEDVARRARSLTSGSRRK